MDNKNRKGESSPHPYRTSRLFFANGSWYFSTREGWEIGPFADRAQANVALLEFLHEVASQEQSTDED